MRIKSLLLASLIVISSIVQAALPPTAESMRRFKAIADSKEVYDALGGAVWITSITQDRESYVIKTDECELRVSVNAVEHDADSQPQMIVIPPLIVKVGKLTCHKY